MLRVVLSSLLVAAVLADTYCKYQPVGDEILTEGAPIANFRTSGMDLIRPAWCLASCNSRTSIKGMMRFKPANASSEALRVRTFITHDNKVEREVFDKVEKRFKPIERDDDTTFCIDDNIAKIVSNVFSKFNDTTSLAEGLNYYINKPGWAYLVYQMGPPPSINEADNVKQDNDFCFMTMSKVLGNNFAMWNVFAGATYN